MKGVNLITGYRIKPTMYYNNHLVTYPNASRVEVQTLSIGNNTEEITYEQRLSESI